MFQWMKNKQNQKATMKDKIILWSVVILLGLIHASVKDIRKEEDGLNESR